MDGAVPKAVPGVETGADNETALVSAARRGDAAAFTALVARYERKIFRLALRIMQNHEDAEEVMQDAFLKAYAHLDRFEGHSRFYTWLVRIAVNEGLMRLRKRRPTVSLDQPVEGEEDLMPREIADWGPSPEERFAQGELREILASALDKLDPSYRIVFWLRDVEELSTEETAKALELSVPAVKSRLLRARLQLRERLNRIFSTE